MVPCDRSPPAPGARAGEGKQLLLVLLSSLLVACGDGGGWSFEGQPGQSVRMELGAWVPVVPARVADDRLPRRLLMDSGSSLTVLDSETFFRQPGRAKLSFVALGLTFVDFPGAALDLFGSGGRCGEPTPDGLLGGDLMRRFQVGLDYRAGRAVLHAPGGPDPPLTGGVAAEVQVGVRVLGGGAVRLPGTAEVMTVPPTRVVLDAVSVEGRAVSAILDTGASLTVVSPKLFSALGGAGRPLLCCQSVTTLDGAAQARLSRVRELRVGTAVVRNQPVLVLDRQPLFDQLSAEVGREVALLLGGSFLRQHSVVLDYPGRRLRLGRYASQDHLDPDEWVGPGFSFCASRAHPGELEVLDVFQGSHAASAGVRPGDLLLALGTAALSDMSQAEVYRLLRQHRVGDPLDLKLERSGNQFRLQVELERSLEDYR
jgi:hypothetical protein